MSDLRESIGRLEKSILEDGRVDRAEAQILLAFARPRAAESALSISCLSVLGCTLPMALYTG